MDIIEILSFEFRGLFTNITKQKIGRYYLSLSVRYYQHLLCTLLFQHTQPSVIIQKQRNYVMYIHMKKKHSNVYKAAEKCLVHF